PGEFDELIGEPVVAIGYPFADERAITTGVFTGPVSGILGVKAPLYRATAQIAPGSSGGALWAEIAGTWKIIGTAFAMRRDAAWVSYFTTPDKIHALLR